MHRVFQSSFTRLGVNFQNITRIFVFNCNEIPQRINRVDGATVRGLSFTRELSNVIQYSEEVEDAIKQNSPIVALESTIITHGMPYPDNLATAIRVEEIIRQKGVVPATIAILDGKVQVGMDGDILEKLARCATNVGEKATKCSRRDITTLICEKTNGGTTVGGTMTIARIAGIPIMATGGIGGVHRGAETSLDVSSDLTELGRNRVAVVCAGVKAILDIPKTLEYLETQGVPVITIGDTDNFPAFYSRETSTVDPVKSPSRVTNSQEAAKILRVQEILKLDNGILFAVPIPKTHALESSIVESIVRDALVMAEKEGIRGKYVTPYLLKQLNRLTSGGFLKANQALVENNARVAAEMALALHSLRRIDNGTSSSNPKVQQPSNVQAPVVVVGGATADMMLHVGLDSIALDGRTHRARSRESHGGVGRNITAALVALGLDNTRLVTVVGNDSAGRSIIKELGDAGETIEILSDAVTPRYTAILDNNGECRFGIGEMDTFETIDANLVRKHRATMERAGLVVLDGNLPHETIRASIDLAARNKIPVWYEPTDVSKASKIFEAGTEWINLTGDNSEDSVVRLISPNVNELIAVSKYLKNHLKSDDDIVYDNLNSHEENLSIELISELAKQLARVIPVVVTTLGSRGIIVARRGSNLDPFFVPARAPRGSTKVSSSDAVESRWYPAAIVKKRNADEKFSVSGCGDCLAAAIITGSYKGLGEADCVKFGLEAATLSLKSHEPVPRTLKELRKFFCSDEFYAKNLSK